MLNNLKFICCYVSRFFLLGNQMLLERRKKNSEPFKVPENNKVKAILPNTKLRHSVY